MPFFDQFKRQGTRSVFSVKKKETVSAPNPREPERPAEQATNDVEIKGNDDKHDSQIEKSQGRDPQADANEGKSDSKGKKKVENNEALTSDKTIMKVGDENIFSLFWENLLHTNLRPITITKTAEFIPNAMALQELLHEALPIIGRSKWIQKHEPTYCEYAAATGFMIVYYLQILRARKAATELDGYETSLLNRFFALHKEESIEIPEWLFPFMSTIVATELEDRKYDWVIPSYGLDGHIGQTAFENRANFTHGIEYARPQIPYMLAILASFGAMTQAQVATNTSEDLVFTPIELDYTQGQATHLFNQDLEFGAGAHAPTSAQMILATCGVSFPFRFHNGNADDARKYIKTTSFYGAKGVNFSALQGQTLPGTNTAMLETVATNRIDLFLNMGKDKSLKWFSYLKEQMTIVAKQSKVKYNLSQVPTTGGLESSIICRLKTNDNHGTAANPQYAYTDAILNVARRDTLVWYPQMFRDMTGSFRTTRAGVHRKEELQALAFATNSVPPIVASRTAIANFRRGEFFTHAAREETQAMELGNDDDLAPGPVEMFAGWRTDVAAKSFKAEPLGGRA